MKENETIIKTLNMYGRVPETWELLNEIDNLNNIIDKLQEENKHLKDLYNQALKDYDELLKEQ